jgi:signal transduction histidine kinase
MASNDLQQYQKWLHKRLQALAPVFAKAAVGDFSGKVAIPPQEDELTEFLVGIQIMLDTVREKVAEFEASVHELQAANDVIANEKVRVEAILNSLGEGVLTVDNNWRTTYVNEPAVTLLGEKARILSQDATLVVSLEDGDGNRVPTEHHPIRTAILRKRRVAFGMTMGQPYFVKSIGLHHRRVGMTITPTTRAGRVTGAAVVVRDITDESNMDRAKSEIISIASHQLRSPLTAVRWYVKTLIDDKKLTDEQRTRYLQQVYDSNNRMVQLVDALLNVSRIDLGTLNLAPVAVDVKAVLRNVLKDLEVEIKAKKLKVNTIANKHMLPALIDPSAMQIILQNLVSNAIKYSPKGKEINVSLQQQATEAVIEVRDKGVGIPDIDQRKIFTKLFRASNAPKVAPDGSGLGLYITKAMVERAHGKISFESTEKRGTVFYVIIPSKVEVNQAN